MDPPQPLTPRPPSPPKDPVARVLRRQESTEALSVSFLPDRWVVPPDRRPASPRSGLPKSTSRDRITDE